MNKFSGFLAQIVQSRPSGVNELDKIEQAKMMYRDIQKNSFQFEHCWNVLRHQPKWVAHIEQCFIKKKQSGSSCPSTRIKEKINLDEGNTSNSTSMELPRPIGKKAKKEKAKKGKGNDVMEVWVKDKRKMHEQKMKLNERKISLLAEDVDMEKKKIEIQ